ncbi:MAG: hypothetical protein ACJ8C4_18495 [Gemmataceae bacterium]
MPPLSMEQLRALGWHGTSFHDLAGDGEERTTEKWQFLTGTGGMKTAPAVQQDVLDLQARFGHLLQANPPKQPTKNFRRPTPPPPSNSETPEEVPF